MNTVLGRTFDGLYNVQGKCNECGAPCLSIVSAATVMVAQDMPITCKVCDDKVLATLDMAELETRFAAIFTPNR